MKLAIVDPLMRYMPAMVAIILVALVMWGINRAFQRNPHGEVRASQQLIMLLGTAIGVLIIIFALPLSDTGRGQLLSLLGIVVTAVIALSSTTFVANVMAGLMLRAVNSFRPGDFVRCGDHFGRVTERGIFHTEIQTEDRDLTTLPNMYLVTNPVTVVRDSGTVVSAQLSLGYDVSHVRIEELLKRAAEVSGLEEAFVMVMELGDFAVSYRVGGFFKDVNRLLTAKSKLRKQILDVMHENGIEIVSPHFMNQRVLQTGEKMIPGPEAKPEQPEEAEGSPEEMIFDKADTAAQRELLKETLAEAREDVEALDQRIKEAEEGDAAPLKAKQQHLENRIKRIEAQLDRDAAEADEPGRK